MNFKKAIPVMNRVPNIPQNMPGVFAPVNPLSIPSINPDELSYEEIIKVINSEKAKKALDKILER